MTDPTGPSRPGEGPVVPAPPRRETLPGGGGATDAFGRGYAPGQAPPGAGGSGALGGVGGSGVRFDLGGSGTRGLALAGWWRRVGAQLIDLVIILVIAAILLLPFGGLATTVDTDGGVIALILGFLAMLLAIALVALLYAPLMMSRTNGKTVGGMATGIRVVRADGEDMTFSSAALREVGLKFFLIGTVANSFTFGLASLLDVLWPLWDEEKRALHDFLVDTRTVLD